MPLPEVEPGAGSALRETADRLFADVATPAMRRDVQDGVFPAAAWTALEQAGLTAALLPEAAGGFGIAPVDALSLLRVAGRHALPLPLAETMLAGQLLAAAGLLVPHGLLTLPGGAEATWRAGRVAGVAWDVPWGRHARGLVLVLDGRVGLIDEWTCEAGLSICGEPSDTLRFDTAAASAPSPVSAVELRAAGAATRTLLIAGALEAVLAMTVRYAGERVQFGKPIGRLQAVQQQIAMLAGQAAAADAAAGAAAEALTDGVDVLAVAAAKVRAGEAAGIGAGIAHQVHGAIGFTEEYALQRLTRRLWAWRDAWGTEAEWSLLLGRRLAAAGGDGLWGRGDVPMRFDPPPVRPEAEALRAEVRGFLQTELADRPPLARAESWSGLDPAFSRRLGKRGWLGMTWPRRYGGQERHALDRYVVIEEMLAAGAPVAAHWIADRQSGPALLRYGTEAQREAILPRIAAGACYFCIGMSEPDVGSDLASARTRASRVQGGWLVRGTKLWSTNAHVAHYMILFCRTAAPDPARRHAGVSQFVVDLSLPGITIRPVNALTGEHHFNEVVFDDVFLPDDALLGAEGDGWAQVTGELANERSGPERFLSSFTLLAELVRALGPAPDDRAAMALGRLGAHLVALRRLSRSIAGMLEAGADPAVEAALVKDLGALLEQDIPEVARLLVEPGPPTPERRRFFEVLHYTTMHAPSFSLRGGTREILRGIVARGLGLR